MKLEMRPFSIMTALAFSAFIITGCGEPATNTTVAVNMNANAANSLANANSNADTNTNSANTTDVAAREPDRYEATVNVKVEAVGDQQKSAMPTLSAKVAREGNDRRMEFSMPAGGRVVFLDKGGVNYLILPDKRQYAELTQEALGFDVRRMLMPEQIVQQIKGVPGVQFVGEEQYNGRTVLKYQYGSVSNTQTQAGQVTTESYLIVDKETGLPLRSETFAQSQSGGNVQGFSGLRLVTEISDIKTEPTAGLFDQPTAFQKIESSQVRTQVDMVFNALGSFVAQMMNQSQQRGQPATSPAASPAR
ncbi:hypothetical protein BH20ACI2_BH20ACI2_26030 [soil metagenome]